MHNRKIGHFCFLALAVLASSAQASVSFAQSADRPWMSTNLSPEERAELVLQQMTLDEKLVLLIPPIVISDAGCGVKDSGASGRYSTATPSSFGAASSWDVEPACPFGDVIGGELRAHTIRTETLRR
jgi:beta-glucosidase